MKKALLIILSYLMFTSCSVSVRDYYTGFIIDELDRPVSNVSIKEDYHGNVGNESISDQNGYFNFKRTGLPEIVLSKTNYLNDTLRLVGSHAGEQLYYSTLITKDSTIIVLKGNNNKKLQFTYNEIPKPEFNSITNSKYDINKLFGTWLVNGDKNLEGFRISNDEFYTFGFDGNRNMRYQINYDSIIIYKDNYYYQRKGVIKEIENNKLIILWNGNETTKYESWK